MSVIDSLLRAYDREVTIGPIYGHLGFALVLRRELLPMLQDGAGLGLATRVLGMQIIESEHIPPGHYMVNGIPYRYTKPTIDEMCSEAKQRLAVALELDVARHMVAIRVQFAVLHIPRAMRKYGLPAILQRQAA